VRELAEGRVWDGESALELGLVDELGSLENAIAAAAELAGLHEYEPIYIREELTPGLLLLRMLGRKPAPLLGRGNTGHTPWWLRGLIGRTDYRFLLNDPQYSYAHALISRPAF
jgi:protease IV